MGEAWQVLCSMWGDGVKQWGVASGGVAVWEEEAGWNGYASMCSVWVFFRHNEVPQRAETSETDTWCALCAAPGGKHDCD